MNDLRNNKHSLSGTELEVVVNYFSELEELNNSLLVTVRYLQEHAEYLEEENEILKQYEDIVKYDMRSQKIDTIEEYLKKEGYKR